MKLNGFCDSEDVKILVHYFCMDKVHLQDWMYEKVNFED